jgi:very-short-patch-repair endonuclease
LRHVFRDDPRFAHGVRQLPVQMGSRVAYLDLAFVAERVAVELDGAAYHGTPEQRERDMRRDAALSALGWIVLRFSYQRLHTDPDGVRNEVDAVLCTRRRQLTA